MSRRPVNGAAFALKQAKARAAAASKNVVPTIHASARPENEALPSSLYSRIDETPDPQTGARRLRVIMLGKKTPEVYDMSQLLVQPELARFLAEGFRMWAGSAITKTRYANQQRLITIIGSFLTALQREIALSSIDEGFWTALIAWLNGPRKENGQPWAPGTRRQALFALKSCINALLDHPEHGAVATDLMYRSGFPYNPWPGSQSKTEPTSVLSGLERQKLIEACLSEIADLRARLDEREAILETGRIMLEDAQTKGCAPAYRSEIGICAARITDAFPDTLPSFADMYALDRALGNAVQYSHLLAPIRRLLHATFRELVPFVLLIGVKTAFNPDTLLTLAWSRLRVSVDGRAIVILGVKNRAAGLQISITSGDALGDYNFAAEPGVPFGLADLLDLLRRFTKRTRTILADQDHVDRLFIGVPLRSGSRAKSYDNKLGPSHDMVWKGPLQKFIEDHHLNALSLAMLRPSEAEAEWRRTGDLLAVRDRLGQKSMVTTRTHYTSDGMRRESRERVAEVQTLYHRWAETEGRSDPRHQPERCRSAATPGFGCWDPFDSPRPGQRKGKLCNAYGECPVCPLAQMWPRDVQAVAYYLALPKAILDARHGRISPRHWAEKWPPILNAHHRLLDEIPPQVCVDASRFHINLKPVG